MSTGAAHAGSVARADSVRGRGAFTLVELLVVMAVTVLLVSLFGQVYSNVGSSTHAAQGQMNATQGCRAALNTLDTDLESVVTQFGSSVYVKADASSQNVQLIFLTERRGPASGTPPVVKRWTAVAYQLAAGQLVRKVALVDWNNPDLAAAALAADTSATSSLVASNILTFQAVVLLDKQYSGNVLVPASMNGEWLTGTSPTGQPLTNGYQALIFADRLTLSDKARVRSLIVGVAAQDDQMWTLLGSQEAAFASALQPAPLAPGDTPVDAWNRQIASGALFAFPRPAVANTMVAQRTYVLR